MNVLQLIGSFYEGGSERQAVQLTRLLHESGRCNVFVATLNGAGPLRVDIENLGIPSITEYPLTSFYDRNAVQQTRKLARYLKENRIDVIHAHDFYTNIVGMAAAALARTPVRIASRRESSVRPPLQRWAEHRSYQLAHAVVANSDEIRRQVIAEGIKADKVLTFHNGLEMSRVTPTDGLNREDLLKELNLQTGCDTQLVTIVANLRAHFWKPKPVSLKDHSTFLRAAARVHSSVPNARFVIAGEGELLEPTRLFAAELGIEQETFFLGRCERVADLLAVSDVCVLSSTAEGFSNSILEYMAAGRPVVATDVGGARESVMEGETGYLVPAGDDLLMAQRISFLLRDKRTARIMGDAGRKIVEERFSCEAQLDRALFVYEQLLNAKKNRPVVSRFAGSSALDEG